MKTSLMKKDIFLQRLTNYQIYGPIIFIDSKGFFYTKTGLDEIQRLQKYEISFFEKE